MKITKTERAHLRHLLSLQEESAGVVTRSRGGTLHFDETRALRKTLPTFHTHNLSDKRGGFDPPSRKDMAYLLTFSKKGHYVVSHRGIYYVKISCGVHTRAAKTLLLAMAEMQKKLKPGPRYNARYMQEVNSIAPSCLRVAFTPWSTCAR